MQEYLSPLIDPLADALGLIGTSRIAFLYGATVLSVLILAGVLSLLLHFFVKVVVKRGVEKSTNQWDDLLYDAGVMIRAARMVPPIFTKMALGALLPALDSGATGWSDLLFRLINIWIIVTVAAALFALLEGMHSIYQKSGQNQNGKKPIRGYLQMVKIFIWIAAAILVVTTLANVSPVGFLSGLGAMSAVLLMIFKDSITGFASSLQLTSNDLVRIGDWIEMPKYGADGDVTEITLQTILVRNWDKTITSIPISALTSDSFKNWRGMFDLGGRRVKKSIRIDMRTVRFLEEEDLKRLEKIPVLKPYLQEKTEEIGEWNRNLGIEGDGRVVGRHLTNLGTFRAYASAYIAAHPQVHDELIRMVRYLEPDAEGLPMELYFFTADTRWVVYEGIAADVIDHLLSVMGEFGLEPFQDPTGRDFAGLK